MTKAAHYDVIRSPIVTEKTSHMAEHNKVAFKVDIRATKKEIKESIESIFKVGVVKVNTSVVKGKTKRFRGVLGKRSDVKKAVITIAEGETIDVTAGVK